MTSDEIKEWLEPEEWEAYEAWQQAYPDGSMPAQVAERLAACRKLMEKHQWTEDEEYGGFYCLECSGNKDDGHAPGCLWAQAIKEE